MLDMEAYHDLELTFALLQRVLERSDMLKVRAGIVLQAYLPDSHALQRELIHWSSARVARGGQPVRLRIVKGANLAQERVDSSLAGYPLPIYNRKEEVDASYRRMVLRAAEAESQRAVQVGLASHNLFDIAMGLLLRAQHDLGHGLQIELLEGMATPLQRALRSLRVPVLMYAPIVDEGELNSGIAYLVRRLDENTSEENFLRSSFEMQLGTRSWERERSRFRAGFSLVDSVGEEPSRAGHPAHARDRRTEHNGTHAPDRSF